MAASPLDAVSVSPNAVPSFAVSAGANRKAYVAVVSTAGSDASPATACSLGGQSMTLTETVDDTVNAFDVAISVFESNEAGIAAMSGSAISLTGGTGGTSYAVITWSVQGTSQAAASKASAATTAASGAVSLARASDSLTTAISVQDVTATNVFSGVADPAEVSETSLTNGAVLCAQEADTARTVDFVWTATSSRNNVTIVINDAPAGGTPPSLTDVDTDETVTSTQTGVVFTGTAFGASQGSSTLKLKYASLVSITLSPSAWADTSITSNIIRTSGGISLPYGEITAEVETASGAGTLSITHVPPDARSYVTLTSLATEGKRITAIGLAVGDQLEVTSVTGGNIGDVTLNADGTFDNAIGVTSFTVRGWDATDGTLGDEGTQTISEPDTTAPTITTATVNTAGTSLTLAASEAVSVGAGGSSGFALSLSGGAVTATYSSGTGTSALVYTLSRTIYKNETGTLAYTQPGNGIEDAAGNDLLSFSGLIVTNSSTQNHAPTDIALSSSTVSVTAGVNAVVGALSGTDLDGDTLTYSLVAGTGSTDNASFNISGTALRCNDPAALGIGTYSVRIQTSDGTATYQEAFSITVSAASSGLVRKITGRRIGGTIITGKKMNGSGA